MNENPVRWFEIYVQDLKRAKSFYEQVLQVKLNQLETPESLNHKDAPKFEIWAFPMLSDKTGCGGALVYMEGFDSGKNSTIVYFGSQDCAIEAARVEQAGGKLQREKFSIGQYGYISLAYDTEGNMFGIHSMS